MNIQKLEKQFVGGGEVKGFDFQLEKETNTTYVYRVNDSYYEIFEKRSVPLCIDFENRVYSETEFKEIYPKAKDFGKWAFTVSNSDKIQKNINHINNLINNRIND